MPWMRKVSDCSIYGVFFLNDGDWWARKKASKTNVLCVFLRCEIDMMKGGPIWRHLLMSQGGGENLVLGCEVFSIPHCV